MNYSYPKRNSKSYQIKTKANPYVITFVTPNERPKKVLEHCTPASSLVAIFSYSLSPYPLPHHPFSPWSMANKAIDYSTFPISFNLASESFLTQSSGQSIPISQSWHLGVNLFFPSNLKGRCGCCMSWGEGDINARVLIAGRSLAMGTSKPYRTIFPQQVYESSYPLLTVLEEVTYFISLSILWSDNFNILEYWSLWHCYQSSRNIHWNTHCL